MSETIHWKWYGDVEECKIALGEEISACIQERNTAPILLLLSGGSALSVLSSVHAEDWHGVTATMLDERFGEESYNNFSQLEDTAWYRTAREKGCEFISTKILPKDTKESVAERLEYALRLWQEKNPQGQIIALFGMGVDGHTAGIFPYPSDEEVYRELFLGNRWVVSYDASGKNEFPYRVTTTNTFHKKISHAYVFITGEEKRKALENLVEQKAPLHSLPASIFYSLVDVTIGTTINL